MRYGPRRPSATVARWAGPAAALGSALGALGCIDTDAAVFVAASIGAENATVAQQTLATTIAGSFALELHLGPRASDAAQVQLGAVSLMNADRTATHVDVLAISSSPAFPVHVSVDNTVDVGVSFAAEDNLLEPAAYDELCSVGPVTLSLALDDSLRGGTTTVASAPFALSGCP